MDLGDGVVNVFMRVPASSWADSYLYVPSAFAAHYGHNLCGRNFLHVRNGDIFELKYNSYCGCLVGLSKLFERYKLGSYYFLFLEYGGGRRFDVTIISSSTTEILYPPIPEFYPLKEVVVCSIPIEEPLYPTVGKSLVDDMNCALVCISRYGEGIDEFKFVIRESCLTLPGSVVIPPDSNIFHESSADSFQVFLHFVERGWEVLVQRCPSHILFTTGWLKFASDVGLEVGDLCVFQRRFSTNYFTVGVHKNYLADLCKQREVGAHRPRSFMEIVDEAVVVDGEIFS